MFVMIYRGPYTITTGVRHKTVREVSKHASVLTHRNKIWSPYKGTFAPTSTNNYILPGPLHSGAGYVRYPIGIT